MAMRVELEATMLSQLPAEICLSPHHFTYRTFKPLDHTHVTHEACRAFLDCKTRVRDSAHLKFA
jgi:hypothetical protein